MAAAGDAGTRPGGKGSGLSDVSRLRLKGLVQPCLLLLLQRGPAHGYSLSDQVNDLPCYAGDVTPSIVYRCLKTMERDGLVQGRWDTSGLGPARRVYDLTESGARRLREWTAEMRRLQEDMASFVQAAEDQGQEPGL